VHQHATELEAAHLHQPGVELLALDRERARVGVPAGIPETAGIHRPVDPVQLIVDVAAEIDLAPLEHLDVAHQHRRVRGLVELRIVRRLDHLRRAGQARHVAVLAGLRQRVRAQLDHLAAMPAGRLAVLDQAAGIERLQADAGKHQHGANDVECQQAPGHVLAQLHQATRTGAGEQAVCST